MSSRLGRSFGIIKNSLKFSLVVSYVRATESSCKELIRLVHSQTRARDDRFTSTRAPAEDPAGFIDIRPALILSTKVLADMLTIDEVSQGCSNPKVERFKTEVYGRNGEWAIDFRS